ncbi:MAG: heme-binding protein [Cyanobacteria bacterium SZAS-4]|nr:heme-binding protein [Cyanobacteria bacterium SZAS-4]
MTNTIETISLAEARAVIDICERKALDIKQPMNVAVVDAGGNLVAHIRMDNAWLGSINISINKAFTARCFDITTEALGKESQPGKQFYGIQNSNDGKIMIFGGGVPLLRNGKVVGALGVSGGTGEQDCAVAAAGKKFFEG